MLCLIINQIIFEFCVIFFIELFTTKLLLQALVRDWPSLQDKTLTSSGRLQLGGGDKGEVRSPNL